MHFHIVTHYRPIEKISAELSQRDQKLAESFREACRPIAINYEDQSIVILKTNYRLAVIELDHAAPIHVGLGAWLEYESSEPLAVNDISSQSVGNIVLCVANKHVPKTFVRYRVAFGDIEPILMLFVRILSQISNLSGPEATEPLPALESAE